MNRHLACVLVVASAAAAGLSARTTAHSDHRSPTVEILVDGRAQPLLPHRGRLYVEALKGREYAVRMRNPYAVRVAVALSVDGLNTIDARETSAAAARKWVLDPYETVTIRGWQVNASEARRFEFTTESKSYGQAIGKTANLGVISAVFFKERQRAIAREAESPADQRAGAAEGPQPRPAAAPSPSAADTAKRAVDEYAATGMGRRTDHAVTRVWLDLEKSSAHAVNIRYEFRPQLVQLGVLPPDRADDSLRRREHAQGFSDEYAPVPPSLR